MSRAVIDSKYLNKRNYEKRFYFSIFNETKQNILNINRKDSDATDELKIIHTNIYIHELKLTS